MPDTRPDAMQQLLSRAEWDANAVRDDVRTLVVQRLGDSVGSATSWQSRATTTLAMAALAAMAVAVAESRHPGDHPAQQTMIELTVNEIRRLVNAFLIEPVHDRILRLRWSG